MDFATAILLTIGIWECHGASLKQQLEHIVKTKMENMGLSENGMFESRRYLSFHPGHKSLILGVPSMPSHLPEAEPILPGHTLIRPAVGMLKSSVKFPHKEWEDGSGVYGNLDNLGVAWDGTNDRVLYTGFRRTDDDLKLMPYKNKLRGTLIVLLLNNPNNLKAMQVRNKKASQNSIEPIKASNIKRRQDQKIMDETEHTSSDISVYSEESYPVKGQNTISKLSWFWNTKNAYNRIKVNPAAPKWTELMPAALETDETQWEYFYKNTSSDGEDSSNNNI